MGIRSFWNWRLIYSARLGEISDYTRHITIVTHSALVALLSRNPSSSLRYKSARCTSPQFQFVFTWCARVRNCGGERKLMGRTPPGCRAFSSIYIPRLSSLIGRQSIHTYPTTNSSALNLGKCVHATLSRALRRFSFEPPARVRSRPRVSRRFRAMSPAKNRSFCSRQVRRCWRSKKAFRTWEYDPPGLDSGHLTSRTASPRKSLPPITFWSHDYEAKTADGRPAQWTCRR